jgi:hypothetical protein
MASPDIVVSAINGLGSVRCSGCRREMTETTRSLHGETPGGMLELRCPAGCSTKLMGRGERKRVHSFGAGKKVLPWV